MRETAGNFIQQVLNNLVFPLEEQEYVGTGKDFWCLDWWVIEICKYFFEGEIDYLRFPIAKRLEGNKTFKKEIIVEAALSKMKAMEDMKLSSVNTGIVIFETCRGFDTVLATTIKDWGLIYVVVESKYPEVIKRTEGYLERIPNVELLSSKEIVSDEFFRMKTNGFKGGTKK